MVYRVTAHHVIVTVPVEGADNWIRQQTTDNSHGDNRQQTATATVHHNRRGDAAVSTASVALHAVSFNDMTRDTSDGEGHHAAVVGSAANASSALSTTIHGDAWSPMGVASTTMADDSRLSTLQRSSSHDAQSSL
jgi:hypothetical protein